MEDETKWQMTQIEVTKLEDEQNWKIMEQIIYLKMDNNTEWRCPKIKMPHNGRWQEFEDKHWRITKIENYKKWLTIK